MNLINKSQKMSLTNSLINARLKVKVGSLYYHYKNPKKFYIVNKVAINEADEKFMIVYTSCDHQEITWIRPLDSWLEVQRFSKLE
jgi:hypothetical protein